MKVRVKYLVGYKKMSGCSEEEIKFERAEVKIIDIFDTLNEKHGIKYGIVKKWADPG